MDDGTTITDPAPAGQKKLPPYLRPKPPHDWRWVVGGIGKTLIVTGLLIFAFVGYQLWGTGIQYAQSQRDLNTQLATLLDSAATLSSGSTSPATTTGSAEPGSSAATDGGVAPTPSQPSSSSTTAAVTPTTTPASTATTVDPAISLLVLGGALGRIEIPKIGMDGVIVAGVRVADLKKGVGHYPDTPLPGQQGNAAIAGHRTTYGAPFYRIDELSNGDEITITTVQGVFVYRVTGQSIVAPGDYSVVANVPDKVMLTLTSCNPKYSAKQRIVVTAELDTAHSDPVRDAVINYGRTDPLPSGSDQGTDPATVSPDGDAAAITGVNSADAFSNGWFSDSAAFWPVVLWGLVCTFVTLVFVFIGRRTRYWIGAVAGLVPFVVVLYFVFENVNRLLPPNI